MSLMQQHAQQRHSVAAAARAAQQHSQQPQQQQQQQPQPPLPQQPQRQRQPLEAFGGSSSVSGGNGRRGRRPLRHELLENAAVRKWVARAQEAEDHGVPDGVEAGDEAPPEPCGRLRVPAASSPPPQLVEETGLRHIHVTLLSSTTIKDVEVVSPGANSAMGTVAEDM